MSPGSSTVDAPADCFSHLPASALSPRHQLAQYTQHVIAQYAGPSRPSLHVDISLCILFRHYPNNGVESRERASIDAIPLTDGAF
jgi:hypothetical protein